MVFYINGDLYTGATGNTTAKWDLITDKYLDNAAGYLNDADIHGYTNFVSAQSALRNCSLRCHWLC
jgi:hypothetical protein